MKKLLTTVLLFAFAVNGFAQKEEEPETGKGGFKKNIFFLAEALTSLFLMVLLFWEEHLNWATV
jgi:hypothetical protein